MKKSFLFTVSEMNRVGVECLQRGDFQNAEQHLISALQQSRRLLGASASNETITSLQDNESEGSRFCKHSRTKTNQTASQVMQEHFTMYMQRLLSEDSLNMLITEPLLIPRDVMDVDAGQEVCAASAQVILSIAIAVVLFNLSLVVSKRQESTNQECCIGESKKRFHSAPNILKAKALLEKAADLLSLKHEDGSFENQTIDLLRVLVTLVVFNNLIQITDGTDDEVIHGYLWQLHGILATETEMAKHRTNTSNMVQKLQSFVSTNAVIHAFFELVVHAPAA